MNESQELSNEMSPPPIFLRLEGSGNTSEVVPSWLAKRFRINVFGTSLLSRRAAFEMNFAAWVLLLILVFEWGVWTAAFNSIFYAEITESGKSTFVAVVLAGIYACIIVLYFDRGFVVADTMVRPSATQFHRWKVRLGVGMALLARVVVIALSVVSAAGVLDLVFFEKPIERRIEDENLRWYLVAFSSKLKEFTPTRKDVDPGTERDTLLMNEMSVLKSDLGTARSEAARERGKEEAARRAMELASSKVSQLEKDLERLQETSEQQLQTKEPSAVSYEDHLESLRLRLKNARQRRSEAANAMTVARQQAERHEAAIPGFENGIKALKDQTLDLAGGRDKLIREEAERRRGEREQIRHWIEHYRLVEDKTELVENLPIELDQSMDGRPPRLDIFERYRILIDLMKGRPPMWPPTSEDKIAKLKLDFSLEDPGPCGSVDTLEFNWVEPSQCRSASVYTRGYWILFGIAALVPSMALVTKILFFSKDLQRYYSLEYQAAAGNIDALEQLAAADRLEKSGYRTVALS